MANPNVPDSTPEVTRQLSELESFNLLKGEISGVYSPEEKDKFEKNVLRAGGVKNLVSADLAGAYFLAKTMDESQLLSKLESSFADGKCSSAMTQTALAIFLVSKSFGNTPQQKICEAVRRVNLVRHPRSVLNMLGVKPVDAEKSKGVLRNLGDNLAPFVGGEAVAFIGIFDSLDNPPRGQQVKLPDTAKMEETRVVEKKEPLDLGKVRSKLKPDISPEMFSVCIEFLMDMTNTALAGLSVQELSTNVIKVAVSSPRLLAVFTAKLETMNQAYKTILEPELSKLLKVELQKEGGAKLWSYYSFLASVEPEGRACAMVKQEIGHKIGGFCVYLLHEQNLEMARCSVALLEPAEKEYVARFLADQPKVLSKPLNRKMALMMQVHPRAKNILEEVLMVKAKESREKIKGEMIPAVRNCMELAGIPSAETDAFVARLEAEATAVSAPHGKRKRTPTPEHQTAVTAEDVDAVLSNELTHGKFDERVTSALRAMNLPQNIGVSVGSLVAYKGDIENDLGALLAGDFGEKDERVAVCEDDSFLKRLGIAKVHFYRKKTGENIKNFSAVFEFNDGKLYPYAEIAADGKVESYKKITPGMEYGDDIMTVDTLRQFLRELMGEEINGRDLSTMMTLLGLEEFKFETGSAAQSDAQNGSTAEDAKESDDKFKKTREFLLENFQTVQAFLSALRIQGVTVPGEYDQIAEFFLRLRNSIGPNRQLPPGGVTVLPEVGHPIAPFIDGIDFYNVVESRGIFERLELRPELFHRAEDFISENGYFDAYYALVRFRLTPESPVQTVHVCITTGYDVYIMGVDPSAIEDNEDVLSLALSHLILEAFQVAVMRHEDPNNTRPAPAPSNGGGGVWTPRARQAIRAQTNAEFPVIVVDWRTAGGSDVGPKNPPTGPIRPRQTRATLEDTRFQEIWSTPGDNLAKKMVEQGFCLTGRDYSRLFPNNGTAFVPDRVFVPLRTEQEAQAVLDIVGNHKVVSSSGNVDLAKWFDDQQKSSRGAERDPARVFQRMMMQEGLTKDSFFVQRCRALFQERQKNGTPYGFAELFNDVKDQVRVQDPTITPQDVVNAFLAMSPLNPTSLLIQQTGASDYRLPFDFKTHTPNSVESMPNVAIFDDLEVSPDMPLDVVKIIAGNRARMLQASDKWLRGKERSADMTVAAQLQEQYRARQSGREINLNPRARALIVWEFTDDTYAFAYLDSARDFVSEHNYSHIRAEDRLRQMPRVRQEVATARNTNDFDNMGRWSPAELAHLEKQGVVVKDANGNYHANPAKQIRRKKIAIFTEEQIGYRQCQVPPTNFDNYRVWAAANQLDIGANLPLRDPKTARIQEAFYNKLGL